MSSFKARASAAARRCNHPCPRSSSPAGASMNHMHPAQQPVPHAAAQQSLQRLPAVSCKPAAAINRALVMLGHVGRGDGRSMGEEEGAELGPMRAVCWCTQLPGWHP